MHNHQHHPARRLGVLIPFSVLLLLAALPQAALAQAVGRVVSVNGQVIASTEGGGTRALQLGSRVHGGETLRTGERGRVQIRFDDGALIDLRPDTRFEIERYADRSVDEGGGALLRLFRGALRTITGAIGRDESERYRMETPVATVGVRGTEYAVSVCRSDCGPHRREGLYARVDDGAITLTNEGGQIVLEAGEFGFVAGPNAEPTRILPVPDTFFGGSGERAGAVTGGGLSGGDLAGEDLNGGDLIGGDLIGGNLTDGTVTGDVLSGVDLTGVDLTGVDLTGVDLTGRDLTGGDLTGEDLIGGDLIDGDLTDGDLTDGDLTDGSLTDGSLTDGSLTDGDLTDGDLID